MSSNMRNATRFSRTTTHVCLKLVTEVYWTRGSMLTFVSEPYIDDQESRESSLTDHIHEIW